MTQGVSKGGSKNAALVIVVAVIVVALVVLAIIISYETNRPSSPKYEFSAVNLEITFPTLLGGTGTSSVALDGFNANGTDFSDTVTLNGPSGYAHSVNSVTLNSPGFSIVSVSPNLPVPLSPGGSVAISIEISGPSKDYQGVLTINVYEGS